MCSRYTYPLNILSPLLLIEKKGGIATSPVDDGDDSYVQNSAEELTHIID